MHLAKGNPRCLVKEHRGTGNRHGANMSLHLHTYYSPVEQSPTTSRAALDTVELFGKSTPKGCQKLAGEFGMDLLVFPVIDRDGRHWGHRICFNHVPVDALDPLAKMQQRGKLTLSRADVGIAIDSINDPHAALDRLRWHARQKHARRLPILDQYEGTIYLTDPRATRVIRAYVAEGKHSKKWLTGSDAPVLWMEMEMKSPALRKLFIESVNDLNGINPRSMFDQSIRWVREDWVRERRRLERILKRDCRTDKRWLEGYKRERVLSYYNRNHLLPRDANVGFSKEQLMSWIPEEVWIEYKGFFGDGR